MDASFEFTVNAKAERVSTHPDRPLLDVLREELGLTGTKFGCGEGECGACTVLVDGAAVRSCITAVSAANGRKIQTIEGLATGEKLHPVQQAFVECHAAQCGYCVPGQIMTASALLKKHPRPTDEQIDQSMAGNLCRCGTYGRIREAIKKAAGVGQ